MRNQDKKILTLCIIRRDSQILLGMKKRGWGSGKWNGFGGKIENNESIEEAAKREVAEEVGLNIKNFEKIGIIDFEFQDGSKDIKVYIFESNNFTGETLESEEMRPKWFDINNLPFKNMWPGDKYWLPILLAGKKLKGKFVYDRPSSFDYTSKIIKKDLQEVSII